MLGERFVVQDCLGGNDRAALYRARDNASGGELRVVQVLRRDAIGDGVAIRRFVAERAALLTLLHDNLVTIEDIAGDSATVTIVSEHVVGPDLNRLRHEFGGTLPPALAVDLARQVLLGLSALHAVGLVHTDVRPGSVLALYTDGLVERPGHDIDEGIDWLRTALARSPAVSLEQLADGLVQQARGALERPDDIAVLLTAFAPRAAA